jgi:hypothetical protein
MTRCGSYISLVAANIESINEISGLCNDRQYPSRTLDSPSPGPVLGGFRVFGKHTPPILVSNGVGA